MYLLHQGKPSKERQQGSEATKAAFSGMLPENIPTPTSRDTGLCAWWRGSPELSSAPAWLQTAVVGSGGQGTGAQGGRRLSQAGARGLSLHPAPPG